MTEYRRAWLPGGTWFFTVNLAERLGNRLLVERIDLLRAAFRSVRLRLPFQLEAVVVLPDHLHCIWTLPPEDTDFSSRWSLIKGQFSRAIDKGERISQSRSQRGERGIWQRRFWEHLIRDDEDFNRHVDYIHWNPVKHGWVRRVGDWPHSSFHDYVRRGLYPEDWGGEDIASLEAAE
ncbi:MAG: transposase [Desulfomonile tiedjei]|nr:transposase [Desulfomonile tiedjei]